MYDNNMMPTFHDFDGKYKAVYKAVYKSCTQGSVQVMYKAVCCYLYCVQWSAEFPQPDVG